MSKSGRPSISINGAVGARLAAWCEAQNNSMASVIETLIGQVVRGEIPIPQAAIDRGRKGSRYTGSLIDEHAAALAEQDRVAAAAVWAAAQRRQLAAGTASIMAAAAAAAPQAGLSARLQLNLTWPTVEAIRDQIARGLAHGVELAPGDVLDAALVRMLDTLERVPWCRTCLEASEHCLCNGGARRVA